MAFYSTMTSETQCKSKKTYTNLRNDETNPDRFNKELTEMAKKTIYFLMYSGVPEYIAPLVLQKALQYNPETITRDLYKRCKANKCCVICGSKDHLTLHHVKPVRDFPEIKYRYDNLKPICKSCHDNLHRGE